MHVCGWQTINVCSYWLKAIFTFAVHLSIIVNCRKDNEINKKVENKENAIREDKYTYIHWGCLSKKDAGEYYYYKDRKKWCWIRKYLGLWMLLAGNWLSFCVSTTSFFSLFYQWSLMFLLALFSLFFFTTGRCCNSLALKLV